MLRIVGLLVLLLGTIRVSAQTSAPAAAPQEAEADQAKAPEHPATDAQLREYFALTGAIRIMREALAKVIAASRVSAAPYYPASYWEDMQGEFMKVDFEVRLIPVYQQFLSSEDMAEIIHFYRTPAGKRILATQAPISNESQRVFRKIGGEIGLQVYEKHKDEIESAKKKYEAPAMNLKPSPQEK